MPKDGLCNVMANLKPGMKEYQAQADFEYGRTDQLGDDGTLGTVGDEGTGVTYWWGRTMQGSLNRAFPGTWTAGGF